MEDKWFIYYDNSNLFIYRSWTGICVFIVKFSGIIASEIMVNPDKDFNLPVKEEIPGFVGKLITCFYLKTHLSNSSFLTQFAYISVVLILR